MILVDIIVVGILGLAGFLGTRRGAVLIGLELISFFIATGTALLVYRPLGSFIHNLTHLSVPLSHVIAFTSVWIFTEILCAITMRLTVLKHLTPQIQLSRSNQAGGAIFNVLKYTLIMVLVLIVFDGLPLTPGTNRVVTEAALPKFLLASSGPLQRWLGTGLGHDIGESLNFFTITSEPESHERIELGYTTTTMTVRPALEDDMLGLVNQERTRAGLSPLTMNADARAVARAYSSKMFTRGYFSHIDPEGQTPFDRMTAGHVKYSAAGENLALAPSLQLAHTGLMNSPGHRANILSTKYRTVGIGIIDGGQYGLMITQNFTD